MQQSHIQPLGSYVQDDYEVVAELRDHMPTGVTVSDSGRVFVSFPRWGDDLGFTVAEIVDGAAVAYPDAATNEWSPGMSADRLISVQSVVIDPQGHLWLLDTGAPSFAPYVAGGPKLVRVDLQRNVIDRVIRIGDSATTATTYLNDVRFDHSCGAAGYAYVTDSQATGALIVVDLDTGESWSRLRGHNSTRAEDGFRAVVQGVVRVGYRVGADGIAISATGERLWYCPLSSRRLYSVDTAALRDRELSDERVAETVLDHGDKGASTGWNPMRRAMCTSPPTNTAQCCAAARPVSGPRWCTGRNCCGPIPSPSPPTGICTSVSTSYRARRCSTTAWTNASRPI